MNFLQAALKKFRPESMSELSIITCYVGYGCIKSISMYSFSEYNEALGGMKLILIFRFKIGYVGNNWNDDRNAYSWHYIDIDWHLGFPAPEFTTYNKYFQPAVTCKAK